MNKLHTKLNNKKGATILLALLFLFVTIMVGTLMLASSLTSVEQMKAHKEEQQAYLTVSSAAQMVADILEKSDYELIIKTLSEKVTKTDIIVDAEGETEKEETIFSSLLNELIKCVANEYDPSLTKDNKGIRKERDFTVSVSGEYGFEKVNGFLTVSRDYIEGTNMLSDNYDIKVVLEDENKLYKCTVSTDGDRVSSGKKEEYLSNTTVNYRDIVREKQAGESGNCNVSYTYQGSGNGDYAPTEFTTHTNVGDGEKNYNGIYSYAGSKNGNYEADTFAETKSGAGTYNFSGNYEFAGKGNGDYSPDTYEYKGENQGNYNISAAYDSKRTKSYEPSEYVESTSGNFDKTDEFTEYGGLKDYSKYYYIYVNGQGDYNKSVSETFYVKVKNGKGLYNINGQTVTESLSGNYIKVTKREVTFESYRSGSTYLYYLKKDNNEVSDWVRISDDIKYQNTGAQNTNKNGKYLLVENNEVISISNGKPTYSKVNSGNYIQLSESQMETVMNTMSTGEKLDRNDGYYYLNRDDFSVFKNFSKLKRYSYTKTGKQDDNKGIYYAGSFARVTDHGNYVSDNSDTYTIYSKITSNLGAGYVRIRDSTTFYTDIEGNVYIHSGSIIDGRSSYSLFDMYEKSNSKSKEYYTFKRVYTMPSSGFYLRVAENKKYSGYSLLSNPDNTKKYTITESISESTSGKYVKISKSVFTYKENDVAYLYAGGKNKGKYSILYNYVGEGKGNYYAIGYESVGDKKGRFSAPTYSPTEKGKGRFIGTSFKPDTKNGTEKRIYTYVGSGGNYNVSKYKEVGAKKGSYVITGYSAVSKKNENKGEFVGYNFMKVANGETGDYGITITYVSDGTGKYISQKIVDPDQPEIEKKTPYNSETQSINWGPVVITKGG